MNNHACERCGDELAELLTVVIITDDGEAEDIEVCPDCVEIGDGLTLADEYR